VQFEYGVRGQGRRLAYPVAAGGADACTIHYSRDDKDGMYAPCPSFRAPPQCSNQQLTDAGCTSSAQTLAE